MSDLQDIKHKLLDEDKIIDIFEAMECEHIAVRNGRVEAQLPDRFGSSNSRSVQVKMNDYLNASIRSKGDFKDDSSHRDIFSLVSYIVHEKRDEGIQDDLPKAKEFICKTLGWTEFLEGGEHVVRIDHLAPLKAILKETKRKREVQPNPVLSEDILDDFFPFPSADWTHEGISYDTQKMYGIGFDIESKRITIPMRNRFGKLIGVKGRILKDEDDERKYLYLYPFNNSQELFNFHFAHQYILMEKKVYVFEGEKSCMKMFDKGVFNSVAIGSSDITEIQANILKQCGMDVEIIMCYDSDKKPKEVKELVRPFGTRKIMAIIDTIGLLRKKESPIDRGLSVFRKLEEDCCFEIVD